MRHDQTTQLARAPLLLVDYATGQGIDRDGLLREAGLTQRDIADPDARIDSRCMRRLWRAVIGRLDDPDLGLHVGRTVRAAQLGLVGYAMTYSDTLGGALHRLGRYARILNEAVRYELQDRGEQAVLVGHGHPSLVALRHPVVATICVILTIAREITRTALVPLSVEVPFPRSGSRGAFRAAFGCDLAFDRPVGAITFSAEQMELPNRLADPTLTGYLDDLAALNLAELDARGDGLVDDVRHTLWGLLPAGRPDLWRTAQAMGMSPRTLQRRLREEGTSFSRLLDDLRREASDELLADRRMAVSEVAFLLGYSEPSAFQRAFRRWRGITPRRYRAGSRR